MTTTPAPHRRHLLIVLVILFTTGWATNHFVSMMPVLHDRIRISKGRARSRLRHLRRRPASRTADGRRTLRQGRPQVRRSAGRGGRRPGQPADADLAHRTRRDDRSIRRRTRRRPRRERGHGLVRRPRRQARHGVRRRRPHLRIRRRSPGLRADRRVHRQRRPRRPLRRHGRRFAPGGDGGAQHPVPAPHCGARRSRRRRSGCPRRANAGACADHQPADVAVGVRLGDHVDRHDGRTDVVVQRPLGSRCGRGGDPGVGRRGPDDRPTRRVGSARRDLRRAAVDVGASPRGAGGVGSESGGSARLSCSAAATDSACGKACSTSRPSRRRLDAASRSASSTSAPTSASACRSCCVLQPSVGLTAPMVVLAAMALASAAIRATQVRSGLLAGRS